MIQINQHENTPTEPGWYFYRNIAINKWEGVVCITGKHPFLKITEWFDFSKGVTPVRFEHCVFSEEINVNGVIQKNIIQN